MFREMRRKLQEMPHDAAVRILHDGSSGVLALSGDDGYPYALPISYVLDGDKIYFHSAKEGHKVDAIRRSDKASFCVIAADSVDSIGYTTYYQSVIAFGKVRIVEDDDEKLVMIQKLARKYAPENSEEYEIEYIQKEWEPLLVFEMTIEHMTGKENKDLARERRELNL
ncbi:MAG: pyridoxamine 5'-phosphate oxidase family protein [Spirochaetes bacterium]|uniref:Pyridoxamine 5'-phosphate oxidase family protein n=1 Tax=Candidatus Ornithospirochaeta stercoripullorum TaxID=2840899 RepID=A0A9D9DYK5_9SPIO|nr:pyridoxamine 5'-phosphate oxidase family protein [Candidatus Ornithospirochaeta stercoripullorum]